MKKSELFEATLAILVIILAFMLCLAILGGTGVSDQWAISGPVAHTGFWVYDNMYTPGNGVLYTVDGSSIYAIGQDGKVIWTLPIPDKYNINTNCEKWTGMAAAADSGDFYIVVGPGNQPEKGELLAIGPDGSARWIAPLTFGLGQYTFSPPGLLVKDDRIYIHHYRNQIILDSNGTVLLNIYGVTEPATIDDAGNMYIYSKDNGTIESYDRNGSMRWSHSSGEYNVSFLSGINVEQPYYNNGTLYVWLSSGIMGNGVMALDSNGNKLWVKEYPDEYTWPDFDTTFDSHGNLYLRHDNLGSDQQGDFNGSYMTMIRPDGTEVTGVKHYESYISDIKGLSNGIYYQMLRVTPPGVNDTLNADYYKDPGTVEFILTQAGGSWKNYRNLSQLDTYAVRATDITTDGSLWDTTLPLFPHRVALNASNIGLVMPPYLDLSYAANENKVKPEGWYKNNNVPNGTKAIGSWTDIELMPGNNITYVSMWTINYEVPTFYGQAKAAYSGGIYALDKDGNLLWAKPTGSRVTDMKEVNGTIYYGTDDGRLSATKINLAAGLVLTAAIYLFIRFFMAGAVTRARGRINGNENRNVVLKYIADNPGSGLYDISKGLRMNIGTVRYHLLILGINHRIISFKADGKHVRYFTNGGSYKPEERYLISLMKRESMRRALCALAENPGMSNRELSKKLNLGDSATNRYMRELMDRGIVTNDPAAEGRTSYFIKDEYRYKISAFIGKMGDC
ncbi:MAG TPA: winged helix-turn-helix transcriptional regulator [Methanocella sp.]|uniref:winged helix-turn-helix transcriptional regulator n=1 Tax=Methanocella sp. TaxID=2052833 RepID=UPI002C8D63C5|nr:winged helix-turn-helix transcriptional regulator [Methanocella sp.]HTY91835.1 winged helix-turn-helix transcriptional regulator [Methanocella sp.]